MSNPYAREPIGVVLGGLEIRVPWAAADRWIVCATSSSGPIGVLTGLAGEDDVAEEITNRVLDGRVSPEAATAASYDLLGQAVPYKWWKTVRLLSISNRDDIAGHMVLSGVDPRELTVAQWCMAVYVLLTRNADTKDQFKTDVALDDPPPGVSDDDWMDESDFHDMVSQARAMPGQK